MQDLAFQIIVLLAIAAFVAGFVDSIAGGGGMITVPALLLAGLPPVEALGTAKMQGLFGTASATIHYARADQLDLRQRLPSAAMAAAGGALGALLATVMPVDLLRAALPFLLIAIALFFAFKPNLGDVDRAERLSPFVLGLTVLPLIGFYDGLFGPGGGSFYMLALVGLAGYGVLKATANAKLLNLGSNLGACAIFFAANGVNLQVGLLMGVASFLGARLGAALAIRVGARLIKPLLVIVCVALAIRLLLDPAHPVRLMLGF